MVASIRASTASVLARRPMERAKDRTWKGLIAYRGSPAFRRASSKSRWKAPVGRTRSGRSRSRPGDQLPEAGAVVGEPERSPLGGGEGVEPVLGDVDPGGSEDAAHVFFPFSCACHASLNARVSIQDIGKDGGDHTEPRPLTACQPIDPTTVPVTPSCKSRGNPHDYGRQAIPRPRMKVGRKPAPSLKLTGHSNW